MDLITTHISADFDALGSLVAARKLYPGARLLLPGSPESAVAAFLSLSRELVAVESERECRYDDVDRLILVDTRHASRIGMAARLLDKGVEVHVYDHHPHMKGDVVADRDVYEPVGATVSILADLIRKKRLTLTNIEATVMLLGIYEETGSLTYRSTTKLDVDMVSFLLTQGANLSVVSSYLNRELGEKELSMLTRLITAIERTDVNGVTVSMITIDEEEYTGELGVLIHKLMDLENLGLLFVFIKTGRGRLDIVGRSKLTDVDLNRLLGRFGGGGHPAAACAKIPGGELEPVRAKLLKALKAVLRTTATARDIMSRKLGALRSTMRVDDAIEALESASAGGAPVRDNRGRVVGVITMDGLHKAQKSGLVHARIKGYMSTVITTVPLSTPLATLERMMRQRGTGVIFVADGARILGVIRRTDVLKHAHHDLFLERHDPERQITLNVSKKMTAVLPKRLLTLARRIGRLAHSLDQAAFLVGGIVRDILLGTRTLDLDIVVEGSAIKMGQALARELGASLVVHKRFGTCTVVTRDRLKIDLATARKEVYERPAALPTVEFSSLKDDLIRRDFTINAMAISLATASFGQLIDFFDGQRDLARGRIRVMHDGSFIDDPTRIFRAVRFEQRFGFAIDAHTEGLIMHAVRKAMFSKVEPQRIRDELVLILREKEPLKALRRMHELHELRFLHPRIRFDRSFIRLYHAIDHACSWYEASDVRKRAIERWLVYLMALFAPLGYNETVRACERFVFRRGDCLRISSDKQRSPKILASLGKKAALAPSAAYRLLEPLSLEVILLLLARASLIPSLTQRQRATERIRVFLERYNGARLGIRGEDIIGMGLRPGPAFKKILDRVLYEKIDGRLGSKEDERAFAGKLVARRLKKGI